MEEYWSDMKIVFVTINDILGSAKDGGAQFSKRNRNLLEKIVGKNNVYTCIIAPEQGFTIQNNEYVRCFCQSRSKISIFKYALRGRLYFTPEREREICEYIKSLKCDMVFFSDTRLGTLAVGIGKTVKIGIFVQNIEKNYILHMAKKNLSFLILYPAFVKNERLALDSAQKLICLNQRDSDLLKKIYGHSADFILPITLEDTLKEQRDTSGDCELINIKNILFVGSLFHSNLEGIHWFVDNVMPYVKNKLTVVGRGFEEKKKLLQRENVDVIGTVDRLEEYYKKADAIVSPILSGDGMKVKTAEAMMYGKNIFATREALEGYEVSDVAGIIRCDDSHKFIQSLNAAYDNATLPRFNTEVRKRFCEQYETNHYLEKLKEFIYR